MPQPVVSYEHIYNDLLEDTVKDSLGIPVRFCELDENRKRFVISLIDYSYQSFCEVFLMHEQVTDLEYLSAEITETLGGLVTRINNIKKDFKHV